MFELSFHGGAGTVTGSRHLLTAGSQQILVDAGLFQGLKKLRLLNWEKPSFDPERVDHLLLTHAHIDHAGYLPKLVRDGYAGPIHCTPATRELAELLLLDSAKLQEEDAQYANRKGYSRHKPARALYTSEDVLRALKQFRPVEYGRWIEIGPTVQARFLNAGHILGSAMVEVRVQREHGEVTLIFSGDVGRFHAPLHTDPDPLPDCDFLVIEATYGNRTHNAEPLVDQIGEAFGKAIRCGGSILIPAFAVGRAQLITLLLREAMASGKLPTLPIHIDSPMAINATQIYSRHLRDGNLDPKLGDGMQLFPDHVQFHRSVAESRNLNELEGPRVIIASSGMLSGGRVVHHLHRMLPDPRNLIVLVGFQAAGTRGRSLVEGAKTLRMHGEDVPVRAAFVDLHGLSAHADADELMQWVGSASKKPKRVFVVHAEEDAAAALATRLRNELGLTVSIPEQNERFDLESALL